MKRLLVAGGLMTAFLLAGTEAGAQGSGTGRGKVVDEKGQAVEGATVVLDFKGGVTRKFTVKSNKKGEFIQVGLPPGPYRVTATKDGYQGTFTETRISLGQPTDMGEFKLTTAAGRPAVASAEDVEKVNAELRKMATDAEALAAAGKHDEAIAAFQALLGKSVAAPEEVHLRIGNIQLQKKDYTGAEASFLKALELSPGHARAQVDLATAYQLSGQKDKAAEAMAKASTAGAGNATVQFTLGITHLNAGRTEEAAAALKKAIEIDPNLAEPYYHLGTMAINANNSAEAIAHLEKYLSLNPTNAQYVATSRALLQHLKTAK